MAGKLIFDKHTENLAEIAMVYAALVQKYPKLTDTDSTSWKQKFVEWANEFEELHPDIDDNPDEDYLILIDEFAKEKIFEFGGIEMKPFYFTFGSWEKFPYKDTFLVVYATDLREAIAKFRQHHPDVHDNTVNCSSWYTKEQFDESICGKAWGNRKPAEVIR